ncbi:MAG: GFA family protein [Rhizobiaceae bacterium]
MTRRTATCACGALRVECEGEPVSVSLCHCLECQRRTGGAYGIAAFFSRENVVVSGDMRDWARPSDSGFDVLHHFCPTCGSTVWWEPGRLAHLVAVAVGAFADPAFPPPRQSVYLQHRHPWVETAPGVAMPRRP